MTSWLDELEEIGGATAPTRGTFRSCSSCGARPMVGGPVRFKHAPGCKLDRTKSPQQRYEDRNRSKLKATRERSKAIGICTQCFKRKAEPDRLCCGQCLEYFRKRRRARKGGE
jgi:hypothetical protein